MGIPHTIKRFFRGADTFVGLDLGQANVKALALSRSGGEAEISGTAFLDRAAEGFVDEEEFSEHLGTWLEENGLAEHETVVGIPQDLTTVQVMDFPPNSGTALDSMVAFQTQQLGDLSEEQFASDYDIMPASPERPVPVLVGVCLQSVIDQRSERYQAAGVRLMDFAMNGIAVANACFVLNPESVQEERHQLILDIGAENTTLIVCAGGRILFAGVLLLGADSFLAAVAEKRGETVAEVRRSKAPSRRLSSEKNDPLARILSSFVSEISSALQQWREQESSASDDSDPTRIYLCGGGALIGGLRAGLAEAFQCSVDILRPPLRGAEDETAPLFTAAYGLALQAAGLAPLMISLAPAKVRWLAKRRQRTPVLVVAVALWVLFLAAAFFGKHVQLQRDLADFEKEYDQLQQCENAIAQLNQTLEKLQAVEKIQLPIVEHGNRARSFATVIQKLAFAHGPDDWFVYVGDGESFEQGKAVSDADGPAGRRPSKPVVGHFNPFRHALNQDKSEAVRPERPGNAVVVTEIAPLTKMVASGYSRLMKDEVLEPVRDIVRNLNEDEYFVGVDLIDAGEMRGREDIGEKWQHYLYTARRRGGADEFRFRAFTIGLPLASPVLNLPTDGQSGTGTP